jgi:hypothetical protein
MNISTLLPVTWQFIDAKFEGLYKSNATSHLTGTVIAFTVNFGVHHGYNLYQV